mgnify:CR=1 FL=1
MIMTNKRIRIGKDIAISWEINSPMDLVDTDLTIQMKDPKGNKVDIEDFELVDKTISFGLRGTAFAYLGNYTLTLWYKKGEVGQTVVDVVGAFELVGSTEQEDEGCNCGCGALDVSTVDLYGDLTFSIGTLWNSANLGADSPLYTGNIVAYGEIIDKNLDKYGISNWEFAINDSTTEV